MKRSEALEILRKRESFGSEYEAFSIKQDDEGNDGEVYFSHAGCDVCEGGGNDVFDVTYLAVADTRRRIFDNVHEGQICGACLCSLVNGDDSDLDLGTLNKA